MGTLSSKDLETVIRGADLRPTRQRLALANLLFAKGNRHITAEILHTEALDAGVKISLATIYNNLHQFTDAGLLREVVVDASKSYFDTNTLPHHHFFYDEEQRLEDIPDGQIRVENIPDIPEGYNISEVGVIVRLSRS
ncbi:MAG: transcriptional repressor [Sneathiella sp.]|nr:transcriptional repressor [Sneathiella sp.]